MSVTAAISALESLESRLHMARPNPNAAENVFFRFPLSSDTTTHFYYDRNEGVGTPIAWNGTGQTYSGHHGSDLSGGPRGRPVYAAAPGILIGKDDGWGDMQGPGNGNYVRINHGNNRAGLPITSVYLHFNAGTPTAKPLGSFIAAGEQIGGVGTSGNSTGLHLHFEPQINRVAFDPYKATGSSEVSWWVNQGSGSPGTTPQGNKLLVGDSTQVYELSDNGGSALNVRATPAGALIGSKSEGSLGTILEGPTWAAFNNDYNASLWVWYKVRWNDGLEGWSVQNWIRKALDVTPPAVTASQFLYETNPHRIAITFTEDVGASLQTSDFRMDNLTTGATIGPASITFDSPTRTATLNFGGTLADGNYRLRAIAGGIKDNAGNALTADYLAESFYFTADANRDRLVDIGDFSILAARFNHPGTFSQGDFNYNGTTEIGDFSMLASKFNTSLPAPRAGQASGRMSSNGLPGFNPGTPAPSAHSMLSMLKELERAEECNFLL